MRSNKQRNIALFAFLVALYVVLAASLFFFGEKLEIYPNGYSYNVKQNVMTVKDYGPLGLEEKTNTIRISAQNYKALLEIQWGIQQMKLAWTNIVVITALFMTLVLIGVIGLLHPAFKPFRKLLTGKFFVSYTLVLFGLAAGFYLTMYQPSVHEVTRFVYSMT